MKTRHLPIIAVVSILVCRGNWLTIAAEPPRTDRLAISIDRIRADVKYLAGDRLEGRGIGTRGEELATDYIAREFAKAGLTPPVPPFARGGEGGVRNTFFHTVPLVGLTTSPNTTLSATKGDRSIRFTWGDEFVGQSKTQQPVEDFEAEAVFLGHGLWPPSLAGTTTRELM